MDDFSDIPQIEELLETLELNAPRIENGDAPRRIIYRTADSDEPINDALDDADEDLQSWIDWQERDELPFVWPIDLSSLQDTNPAPLVAVDTGVIRLGETEDGLIIALRGTIVVVNNGLPVLHLFRTGPMYLRNIDRMHILHTLGTHLGKDDIFVELDESGAPTRVKSGVADNIQAYSDRFRNWFERLLQRIAVNLVDNGLVLLDGALTTNTRDTPTEFFEQLREMANARMNALVGVSKQSRLVIANTAVRFWLAENPNQPCYRRLSDMMDNALRNRIMGATYAIRFSSTGLTYRVDVKPVPGQREDEVINTLFASTLMRGGYPAILAQAHAHSYFTSPVVAELEAMCGANYSVRAEPEIDFGGIFGPFGGRYK